MSSNTIRRILSALVLASIAIFCISRGRYFTNSFILVFSVLVIDEIFCNILKQRRVSLYYLLAQMIFITPFIYLNFIDISPAFIQAGVNAALIQNLLLLVYLFYVSIDSDFLTKIGKKFSFMVGPFILFPILSISTLLLLEDWRALICILLLITIGMDTGAWFVGKNFGRTKLWEKVSPKKTVEGLFGGALCAGIAGGIGWYYFFGSMNYRLFALFFLLGIMSQIGDLIQSKIKRQVKIKDSSQLIPGHGGVYDRIDSLLFLAPFFSTVLRYYQLK